MLRKFTLEIACAGVHALIYAWAKWIMHLSSARNKLILASTVLSIFIGGCSGIGPRAKKLLDATPNPPPKSLAPAIDDAALGAKRVIPGTDEVGESIAHLIRVAGARAGTSYVRNQLATGSPISRKSLFSAIYEESLNELSKTGRTLTSRQLIDLQHGSAFAGNEIIQEATSNHPDAQIIDE